MRNVSWFGVSWLVLALAGCSGTRTLEDDGADAGFAAVHITSAPQSLERAVSIAARAESTFAQLLAPNRERGFQREGDAFTSFGWRASERKVFEHLGAKLPTTANEPLRVGLSRFERFQLRLTPIGAAAVSATVDEGRLIYADAFPSTDVIAVTSPQYVEELFLLRDASAPSSFSWAVDLPRGIAKVRFEDTGALVFADARDEGVLRMPPPFAMDANGVRREASLQWDAGVVRVHLETKDLAYPILLDPALEQFLWEKKPSSGAPGPRAGAMMTFHPNEVLLFGGDDSGLMPLGDTWTWNGTTWTQVCTAATCGVKVGVGGGLAYDAARGRSILLHATQGTGESEYAEWTGTAWTGVTQIPSPAPATLPTRRYGFSLTYESNPPGGGAPRVLLLGGGPGDLFVPSGSSDDFWAWNGAWSALAPNDCSKLPGCRVNHAAAYDSNTRRLVVFGGNFADDSTYEWDDATWIQRSAAVRPAARGGHTMVYDPVRKRIIMFGGGGSTADETWEYAGGTWTQITVVTKPPARRFHSMAFDTARGRAVVYGGVAATSASSLVAAEVWEYHTFGAACATNAECDTGACVDGVCCESASCGTCQACNLSASPGTCKPVISTDDPDSCAAPAGTCDASGVCKKGQGQACTAGSQCISSNCVDGVCCSSACNEKCQACAAAKKQSGADDGVCGAAKSGTNPHSDCTAGSGGACGQSGTCDGAGSCSLVAAGIPCGTGSVCEGTISKGQQCDGLGACVNNPTGTDCVPFKCMMGCTKTCAADTDCDASGYCDTSTSKCQSKKKNGTACSAASECENPFCVDGVCCNKPCGGQCEACNTKDAAGTCVPVNGAPVAPREACKAEPTGSCQQTTCNGVDGTKCSGFVGAEVTCQAGACTDGKAVGEVHCDGKGNCPADAPKVCEPYACGDKACKTSCTTNDDCHAPASCDTTTGKCVNAAKCDGEHTLTSADGKTTTDCAPYNCDASGTCKSSCASSSECVSPNICSVGVCVAPPEESSDSGGCAMTGHGRSSAGFVLGALALVVFARRRRHV